MTDPKPLSARRAALLDVLNRELPPGEKLHGWRCEHPDRYPEPCSCADIMADTIEEALDAARASRSEPGDAPPGAALLGPVLDAHYEAHMTSDEDGHCERKCAAELARALAALPASPEDGLDVRVDRMLAAVWALPVYEANVNGKPERAYRTADVLAALPAFPDLVHDARCDGQHTDARLGCVPASPEDGSTMGHANWCRIGADHVGPCDDLAALPALPASPEDGLVERLRPFLRHKDDCASGLAPLPCDCGLAAALAASPGGA